MITLNTEKGLVKVESWEDITSRPGYVADLNPKDKKLKSIIGSYQFKDKIRCGLSNCHTQHERGYLAVTEGGWETNIGKDCGKKYFGVDFETLSRQFDLDVRAKENREKLWSFWYTLDHVEIAIEEIRVAMDGDLVYKRLMALRSLNRGCPRAVVSRIAAMVKARDGLLTVQRLATDKEIDDLEVIEGRKIEKPYYIDEPFAEIKGIDALYPENDLRELLVKGLGSQIQEFRSRDIDQMSYRDLSKWAKWLTTIDHTLDRARAAILSGKKLLSPNNLEPFTIVIDKKDEVPAFQKFLHSLSTGSTVHA